MITSAAAMDAVASFAIRPESIMPIVASSTSGTHGLKS